jgi:type II restriction/modification system DNA methylase subunit YeeA
MQDATEFRTNRDLFSNHYLDEHLPDTDAWESVDSPELQEAYDDIVDLWKHERDLVADRNESQLEEKFIRPMFRKLGVPFEVEESVEQGQRRPDYGFFESDEGARNAFTRRRDGGDFYKNSVAVADAKRWGRKLDTRGEQQRDFENPSYQIHVYLQETPTTWAVLTNGEYWRLYYGPTSHRLDSYYEIHLPTVLESGDLESFKYFYLFFQHKAFLPNTSGDCFLDDVYSESNVFAEELGEDLQDNIYDAIQSLAEGFLTYPGNDLGADDLDLIHDSSLIYLYRLIFVLYAESEGRDLLNTDNAIYEQSYSLNTIKQEITEELDSDSPSYQNWQDNLWDRIDELFQLIDQGSASRNIPEEDLHIPAYNGGLFRTSPDSDDSPEARFLATHTVGDEHLARVIELLTRSQTDSSEKIFVDYSSLDVRHLGSVYEGLLEYQLNVADEPLTLDDGEHVLADEGDEVVVAPDEVYLTTDSGERKATGSYYTPEYVVEYIVENTLEPLVEDIREELIGYDSYEDESGFAEEFAERIFELKILDPAMGSGHFLTNAIDYLAREIIDAQERQAEQQGVETVDQGQDINWARRQVSQHCIYGVDLNPLAVELAKVSLWLRTLAAEQPLAFLDHHLKTGNSLVGSDIEDIDELETDSNGGPNASLADFGAVRRGTIDHLMDVYEEFIAIENTDLADAKEMERKYREIERDDLRTRLVALANVKTVADFGLDLSGGAYERMARALDSEEEWADVAATDWFQSAQAMAAERNFLHWKLEFPEVFYEVDGSARENPGFDAVIGNPPYVRQEGLGELKSVFSASYATYDSISDIYTYFFERGHEILRAGGQFGYIVTNRFLTAEYGAPLRKYLSDVAHIRHICNFNDLPVFADATTYPAIFITEKSANDDPTLHTKVPNLDFNSISDVVDEYGFEISSANLTGADWNLENPKTRTIMSKMDSAGKPVEDYIGDVKINYGIKTGFNEAFIIDETKRDELIAKDEHSEELLKPFISGQDIGRYEIEFDDQYLVWTYVGVEIEEYPAIEEYLAQYESQLRDRSDKGDHWYELRHCAYYDDFEKPKIVFPEVSDEPKFVIDDHALFTNKTAFILPESDSFLTAVLNSKPIQLYLHSIASMMRGGYYMNSAIYVEQLPVPAQHSTDSAAVRAESVREAKSLYQNSSDELTDLLAFVDEELSQEPRREGVVHDILEWLAERMTDLKNRRQQFNLSLPDYFGTYEDGPALEESYQPPAGLADSILTDTAVERENLRVGEVTVAEAGSKLVVRATARYKPENPEEFETDRWGYTETGPEPAMEFVGLSDAEHALIRAFVPHAVSESGGFAGFRETATKTNSLVDRLEALTLPDLLDVEDGLERYQEAKQHAEELDEKIEKTDELIDQIVYRLYGLNDEEIEIVEEAVEDD